MTDPAAPSDDRVDAAGDADAPLEAPRITGLRVVIEVQDWDRAVAFYRDALGLTGQQGYANDSSSQLVLDVGHAELELVHPVLPPVDNRGPEHDLQSHAEAEDGEQAPRLRLSFESGNAIATVAGLVRAGAELVVDAVVVASDSLNARLVGPEGVPITVFESLSGPDFSEPPPTTEDASPRTAD